MNSIKIQCYKLTFEAIQQVRAELATHAHNGDNTLANDALLRLSNLYASINAEQFIECMNELEQQANVVKVNFKKTA